MQAPVRQAADNTNVTIATLGLGVGAYTLQQSLLSPVLATLQSAFHSSQAAVTWVITAYLLSASVCTPILGRLGDLYGKKRMFVIALAALAIGGLLAGIATSLPVLILARVIQGAGGGVLPLSFGIISDELPSIRVPGGVGLISALSAVGGSAGLILAGPIVDTFDYHWLFWLPLLLTAGAALAAHLFIPPSPTTANGRLSWPPVVLLSGWLVTFLLAISEAPSWGWGSSRELGLLALAAVLLAAWCVVETRVRSPLVDMRMMRIRGVWTTNVVALLLGVGMYVFIAYVPAFVQTPRSAGYGFGSSITESGVMTVPQTIMASVCGVFAGRIAARFGLKNVLTVGAVACMTSFMMLAELHDQKWQIYAAMAVLGIGIGCAFSAMSGLIVAAVPAEQTGVAAGMNANIRTIGGAIGAASMATVVTAGTSPGGFPPASGYTHGYYMLAGAAAVGAAASLLVPAVRRRGGRPEPVAAVVIDAVVTLYEK